MNASEIYLKCLELIKLVSELNYASSVVYVKFKHCIEFEYVYLLLSKCMQLKFKKKIFS